MILVSNRQSYSHKETENGIICKKSVGGLVSALDPLIHDRGGLWVAWGSGDADFKVCNKENEVLVPENDPSYMIKRIKLSDEEVENYYRGFANRVLWPLFHLFIEKMHWKQKYWDTYQSVNKKFADTIVDVMNKDGRDDHLIWIHDYHLSLAPYYIKNRKPNAKIAFFWHIPWPPWEVFGSLPARDEIIQGLLSCELLGFHTKPYVQNFLQSADKKRNTRVYTYEEGNFVEYDNHKTKIQSFPLGISYKDYAGEAKKPDIAKKAEKLKDRHQAEKLILGIDRLDYTKGILYRLKAYESFLENNPDATKEEATLVQIATPSRYEIEEYSNMKKEIDETVGRINARFRTEEWTPVKYFFRRIPQELLLAYYRAADVGLLTPIRDGMNLISKEFIASNQKNGMLILSEFAGASEELKEALIVNPYDIKETANAIKKAIEMPRSERKQRCKKLKEKVKKYDSTWWVNSFFKEWKQLYDQTTIKTTA
ncbi:MAG: trehalose-6-phosphate synthase [Candidatus Thermoplasmatota archaeon]